MRLLQRQKYPLRPVKESVFFGSTMMLSLGSAVNCAMYVDYAFPMLATIHENVLPKDDGEEAGTLAAVVEMSRVQFRFLRTSEVAAIVARACDMCQSMFKKTSLVLPLQISPGSVAFVGFRCHIHRDVNMDKLNPFKPIKYYHSFKLI